MGTTLNKFGLACLTAGALAVGLTASGCAPAQRAASPQTVGGGPSSAATATSRATLTVGASATVHGVRVTLLSVGEGPKDRTGKPTFKISVQYENVGTTAAAFGFLDWTVVNSNGASSIPVADADVGSGELAPGDTRSGDVYFSPGGAVSRVIYVQARGEGSAEWALTQ